MRELQETRPNLVEDSPQKCATRPSQQTLVALAGVEIFYFTLL